MINFVDLILVKLFNKVFLVLYYGVIYWDILEGFLCLFILGCVDYIYCVVDLLFKGNF